MAKIHSILIKNYRCIERFKQNFRNSNFVCIVGRGDSGKSTILNAISAVLSPSWNYSFYDTDFFNGQTDNSIEIEVVLYDLPRELLTDSKYGLYKQVLNSDNEIIDDVLTEDQEDNIDILTIKLLVNKDLEPRWYVVNNREQQEDVEIKSYDRAKLNVFMVSDYIDRHFSWSKGAPLYSLLKQIDVNVEAEKIISDANRNAKDCIKESESFRAFDEVIGILKRSASKLGLSTSQLEVFIDFKNSLVKEGNISLHNNFIPYRLNGKGTKRLLSIAIQLELAKIGGIILIDELEQGLEPDRAKFLAKYLKDENSGQVFFTTHSSDILVELEAEDIFMKDFNSEKMFTFNEDFQGCIRNNPEAFFAKRVIVCEGATEVGICRSINDSRIENNECSLALLGIALVNGKGDNFINYCLKLKKAGIDVCAFCDSDKREIDDEKENLRRNGITIVDCQINNSIEQQLFLDLPWLKVKRLVEYAIRIKSEEHVLSVTNKSSIEELIGHDDMTIRELLGLKAKEKGWYKRTDHGELIGRLWLRALPEMEGKTLKSSYDLLTGWISE